jgi:hypothetical protein
MDGITGMDLYNFFSGVWSARIDKNAENKTVFLDNGIHTDVVHRRSHRLNICTVDNEVTIDSELFDKYFRDRNTIILQDKGSAKRWIR